MSALRKIAYANNNDQGQQFSGGQAAGIGLGAAGLAGGGMYAYHRNQMGKAQTNLDGVNKALEAKAKEAEQHKTNLDGANKALEAKAREVEAEKAAHSATQGKLNNVARQLNQANINYQAERAAHVKTNQNYLNTQNELQHSKNVIEKHEKTNRILGHNLNKQYSYADTLRKNLQQKARETEAEKAAHQQTQSQFNTERAAHAQTRTELGNANTQLEQKAREVEGLNKENGILKNSRAIQDSTIGTLRKMLKR